MSKRKMGGLGKLSQFSGIKHREPEPATIESESEVKSKVQESEPSESSPIQNPKSKIQNQEVQNQEKLVTVNIKITKSQKDWLAETATQVRDNNTEPVPPAYRVYPQHLIGVAIDLLKEAEVDWRGVKNVDDLREQLNL